jgi:RNA polymerase sigma-70 factor, ECF subfamily
LLRIHRGLASVRSEGALVGWMYQVTRNALADHLRASRPADSLDDDLVEAIDPDDAAFKSLARCVAPFVAMLPVHYREAVELVELRGSSQVQAAAQLGIPLSTMKSRVQRGRAHLRELLETCCAIDLDTRGHVVDVTPRTVCACGASCGPRA